MAEHATKAYLAWGTRIDRGNSDGPPETFAQIHEVTTAAPPNEQADDVEVSHLESPARTKEYIVGMIETGEVSFSVNWNPVDYADHVNIRTDKSTGTTRNWRIVLPLTRETITFPAYVKGIQRNIGGPNDPVTADITLKVAGAVAAV